MSSRKALVLENVGKKGVYGLKHNWYRPHYRITLRTWYNMVKPNILVTKSTVMCNQGLSGTSKGWNLAVGSTT